MRIWIEGDTKRDQYLKELCKEKGCFASQPDTCEASVLQLPFSTGSAEIINRIPDNAIVVCGKTDDSLERLSKEKQWKMNYILKDETYAQENAALTAEGAIYYAMEIVPFAIKDAVFLVVGYGRIGKQLTKLLRGLGAEVIVAARREESRLQAGNNSISIDEIENILSKTDCILNTVPYPILLESSLKHIKQTAYLFELASKPYGIDLEAANRLRLNCFLENGIPGRYCPQSAAETVFRYLERTVFHE